MKSNKNDFDDASTDELYTQLDMLVTQRARNQARRRGIEESIEQLQKYKSELYAEYRTLDEEQAKVESVLIEREKEEGDEPEVMTDGGVDIDEHVEPVFESAIDGVAEDYDVGRDELARAVADDLTWVGVYDSSDEYEEGVVHVGDRDSLDVREGVRKEVQMVHDRAANELVGVDVGAYDDMYVAPTSLAPDSYTPVNGETDDE